MLDTIKTMFFLYGNAGVPFGVIVWTGQTNGKVTADENADFTVEGALEEGGDYEIRLERSPIDFHHKLCGVTNDVYVDFDLLGKELLPPPLPEPVLLTAAEQMQRRNPLFRAHYQTAMIAAQKAKGSKLTLQESNELRYRLHAGWFGSIEK
jgi:hypothetical protein